MGVVASLIGDVVGGIAQNQQNQQTQAFENANYGNQSQALGQEGSFANQLAAGLPFQELKDVQQGGIKSIQSQLGGIANPATLIKQLMGGTTENALQAGVNTRSANLAAAGGLDNNIAGQYGLNARTAMGVPQPNPWANLFQTLGGLGSQSGPSTAQPGGNPGAASSSIDQTTSNPWGTTGAGTAGATASTSSLDSLLPMLMSGGPDPSTVAGAIPVALS